MTTVKIYHNPRCSKSREALSLLQERELNPIIINYLQKPPSLYSLQKLQALLGLTAMEMLRGAEEAFSHIEKLNDPSDDDILAVVMEYPILLQRPIVVCQNKAVIARPAKLLLDILSE